MKESIKIIPPEGMECYLENNEIKFRKVTEIKSYEDISKELFLNKNCFYFGNFSLIGDWNPKLEEDCNYSNICSTKEQARKILAINKLINVANYLNSKADKGNEDKYYSIYLNEHKEIIIKSNIKSLINNPIRFNTENGAKEAIKILGEDIIKLAIN